jgi:23S rRNA (guanosine2251-2'-O)-methyltransferase
VIGLRACEEAAKVRRSAIAGALIRADWERASQLRELKASLDRAGVPSETRSQEQLDAIGSGHQGIALCVQESPKVDWAQLESAASAIVLILDGLEDPQNLGSILRTAWLTGVDAVLAPADRAVGLTPTACKVASGGAEHVPFETHASFGPAMQRLKDAGFWLYGLGEGGRAKPWDLQLAKKTVWVVGSEASGMRVATERACDELVRIPQVATGSSYNAAVAVAMALGETCRQMGRLE